MSEKRNQLEQAATDAVQRSGFNNLSFRNLADEVGIKSSSVHYYFPEKSDLATALIKKYSDDFAEQLKHIDDRKISPRNKLEAFIKIFDVVMNEQKFCLCGMMAAEVDSLDETSKQALVDYFQRIEDWLTSIIEQGKDQLSGHIRPRVMARMMVSGLEGAILIDRVKGRSDLLRSQRELVRAFMN